MKHPITYYGLRFGLHDTAIRSDVWGTRVDLNLTNATLELTERDRVAVVGWLVGWLGWLATTERSRRRGVL